MFWGLPHIFLETSLSNVKHIFFSRLPTLAGTAEQTGYTIKGTNLVSSLHNIHDIDIAPHWSGQNLKEVFIVSIVLCESKGT